MPAPAAVLRFLVLIALYVGGDALGELLIHGADQVTLVWLPAGVSLAALLLYGRRYWPFIPIAELIVQTLGDPSSLSFIAFTASANTVGALVGCSVVQRYGGRGDPRFVMRSGYLLLAAAALVALSSACIGVSGLYVVGYAPSEALPAAFAKWVVANFFGVLLLTPAVLLAATARISAADYDAGDFGDRREMAVWLLLLLASLGVLMNADRTTSDYVLGLASLPLTLMIWCALRFPPVVTALASLLIGLTLSVLAGFGLAGFSQPEHLLDAVILLTFLSVIAVVPLLLSGAANQNRLAARRLLRRARTDDLTSLPNRTGFEDICRQRQEAQPGSRLALAYLDLDNFKVINDTAGHAAGDQLVQQLAGGLRAELHGDEVLARLGGDEFALLLVGRSRDEIDALAQRVREQVAAFRFPHGGHVFATTVSIGVVEFSDAGYARVLAQADAACFTAKEMGGNRVQWGSSDEAAVAAQTTAMRWAMRITQGIEQDHFRIYCQSIAALHPDGDRGRHYEVLIRLYDPEHDRLLMPGQFVPAAERFRMGPKLDRHVLDRSLRWLEANPAWAAQTTSCSINLCAASVEDPGFVEFLHARLAASSVPAHKLCFEITETSAVRDLGEAQRFIDGVRTLGCRLSLDDFGTGFCSFAYLNSLDVDYFKIDGSFVRRVAESDLSLAIVKAIADIARSIDKKTVAEFVETPAIRERLLDLGVDYAQGYAIDEPVPIERYFAATKAGEATIGSGEPITPL